MSSIAHVSTPSADVIVVETSPSDLLHPPPSSSLLSPPHFPSTALSPPPLSSPPSDNDVIVLDSPPAPSQPPQATSPIRIDDSPRKRRRSPESNPSSHPHPQSRPTSSVIVVDDDDVADVDDHDDDSPVEIARVVRRLQTAASSASAASSAQQSSANHHSSITPHVPQNRRRRSDSDDVIEVSAVGPRASTSPFPSSFTNPVVPVMPVEPQLSAPRSRSPVYQRAQRQGSSAMSMPQLFNRAIEPPSASTSNLHMYSPIRRRYGVPASSMRPMTRRAQASSSTAPTPAVPGFEELNESMFPSSFSASAQSAGMSTIPGLDGFGPVPSAQQDDGEGLPDFGTLNQRLGSSQQSGPSSSNVDQAISAVRAAAAEAAAAQAAARAAAASRRRGLSRAAGDTSAPGPSHAALLFRPFPSVNQSSGARASGQAGSAPQPSRNGSNRHVTFSDTVTAMETHGISRGDVLLSSDRSSLGEPLFTRLSSRGTGSSSGNGQSTFQRQMGSASGSSATGGATLWGVRIGAYRRRNGGSGSSSGASGHARRRATPGGRSMMHQYYHVYTTGGATYPGTIHAQILRRMAMGERLDYEQLVQLDDQVNREKNRADKDQIEALPLEKAGDDAKEIRCCICMCDVEAGEELRVLPCGHKYHKGCIDEWLTYNGCCPVDKKRIAPTRSRRKAGSSSRRQVRQRTN